MISFFIQCLSSSKIVKNINILLWRRVFNFSHILLNLANFSPESTETCEKSLSSNLMSLLSFIILFSILSQITKVFNSDSDKEPHHFPLFFLLLQRRITKYYLNHSPMHSLLPLLFLQLTDKIIA